MPLTRKTVKKELKKMNDVILSAQNLSVSFSTPEGDVKAVNHLSFDLKAGQSLAVGGACGAA